MSYASEKVKEWRRRTKERIVDAFDGKCGICGYNRCYDALALHHLDPFEKEFNFGKVRANSKSWDKIVAELRKCVLLCHICHTEYHAGLIKIPDDITRFNEKFANYKPNKPKFRDEFCQCGNQLNLEQRKFCSQKCASQHREKVDWSQYDLYALCLKHPMAHVSEMIGVSDNALRKRLKKMNIISDHTKTVLFINDSKTGIELPFAQEELIIEHENNNLIIKNEDKIVFNDDCVEKFRLEKKSLAYFFKDERKKKFEF